MGFFGNTLGVFKSRELYYTASSSFVGHLANPLHMGSDWIWVCDEWFVYWDVFLVSLLWVNVVGIGEAFHFPPLIFAGFAAWRLRIFACFFSFRFPPPNGILLHLGFDFTLIV